MLSNLGSAGTAGYGLLLSLSNRAQAETHFLPLPPAARPFAACKDLHERSVTLEFGAGPMSQGCGATRAGVYKQKFPTLLGSAGRMANRVANPATSTAGANRAEFTTLGRMAPTASSARLNR
jgi:hypothetical protein